MTNITPVYHTYFIQWMSTNNWALGDVTSEKSAENGE